VVSEPTTDDAQRAAGQVPAEGLPESGLPVPEHVKITDPDEPGAPAETRTSPEAGPVDEPESPAAPAVEPASEATRAVEPESTGESESEPDVACPSCGAQVAAGSKFCEVCGSPMTGAAPEPEPVVAAAAAPPARPCARCGGRVAADGYCEECGAPAMSERDHFEVSPSATVGGVCDRGITHARNEDAMALDIVGGVTMIVVCDGVSTAPLSDQASLAACAAALATLAEGAPGGPREVTEPPGGARTSAWGVLHDDAAARANEAVLAVPVEQPSDAPSCTYVAAVVHDQRVVVASVGDSRAYWLPDEGRGVRLTIDDSWAQEMLELGVPASRVESSPHAHAITRWLGPDAPELKPRTDTLMATTPGWLLLCSDGLWNYCAEADDLGELVRSTVAAAGEGASATDVAGALVSWANDQGGRDNITAVLARLPG
jgi:serine/threonine protein phosphatase PrpC